MQRGPKLHFNCLSCADPIFFTLLDSQTQSLPITCSNCKKKYAFSEDLLRQIKKFEALCLQIQLSEEILGSTSVAIDVGPHHVKVPFRMLLTRLGSVLDLTVAGQKIEILFRTEPLKDFDELLKSSSNDPS